MSEYSTAREGKSERQRTETPTHLERVKLDHGVAHVEQLDQKLKSRTLIVCIVPLLVGAVR